MNKEEFDILWDRVITRQAISIVSQHSGLLFADYLKDDIYSEIKRLITHCKSTYMRDYKKYVDRHKIGAIVIVAILKHTPIKIVGAEYYNAKINILSFNEQLAITAALSVLKAFIAEEVKKEFAADPIVLDMKKGKIKDGIKLPEAKPGHGNYRDNWAIELYFMRKEGNYNILALAHQLFLLETITMS